MIDLDLLNTSIQEAIASYEHLPIAGLMVHTPYFSNIFAQYLHILLHDASLSNDTITHIYTLYKEKHLQFGWGRGKGTPEEIVADVLAYITLANTDLLNNDYDLATATAASVEEYMKLIGIGIDCSGFVYNVLVYAMQKLDMMDAFIASFPWKDNAKKDVHAVGSELFAAASKEISYKDIQPGDLVLLKKNNAFTHVALIGKKEDHFFIAQSTMHAVPTGIHVSELAIGTDAPVFSFTPYGDTPWSLQWTQGNLLFKRLTCLSD